VEKDVPGDVDAAPFMILSLSFNSHSGGILPNFTIKDLCSRTAAGFAGGYRDSSFVFADDDLDLGTDVGIGFGFGFELDVDRALVGLVLALFAGGWDNSLADTLAFGLRLRS
jgi:hypothetical protein